jgi:hypothetical protein
MTERMNNVDHDLSVCSFFQSVQNHHQRVKVAWHDFDLNAGLFFPEFLGGTIKVPFF